MASLKNYLLNLNVFAPPHDSHEQQQQQQQQHYPRLGIIFTRVYILFIVVLLFATGLFQFLDDQTELLIINNPTKKQFQTLPSYAKCSCSQISIPYAKFTSLQITFHQVCSSDFITDRWIKAINFAENLTYFSLYDFRTYGSPQFQMLASFCRLSNLNIDQSISSFYSNTLLSSKVLSENVLLSQIQSSSDQFRVRAPNEFESLLRVINRVTVKNQIISALNTNGFYEVNGQPGSLWVSAIVLLLAKTDGTFCGCAATLCGAASSKLIDVRYVQKVHRTFVIDMSLQSLKQFQHK